MKFGLSRANSHRNDRSRAYVHHFSDSEAAIERALSDRSSLVRLWEEPFIELERLLG